MTKSPMTGRDIPARIELDRTFLAKAPMFFSRTARKLSAIVVFLSASHAFY
jgi:hypothetical protein